MNRHERDTYQVAIDFLEWLRSDGPAVLTAIIPDGETDTITAHGEEKARDFIAQHNGRQNLYYSLA